jgi:hypothetical protein
LGAAKVYCTLDTNIFTEIFKLLVSFHYDYGLNVLTIGWFNFFTLNVTRPKDVETVLLSNTTQNKAKYYDFFRPWLGKWIFVSPKF